MVLLIAGSTHTGKTLLAQRVLEERGWPYLSLDHLKMGLHPEWSDLADADSPDKELTALLWPVAREMIKTAIENGQNLVVEGCYIPCDFTKDFVPYYLDQLRAIWLIFSPAVYLGALRPDSGLWRRHRAAAGPVPGPGGPGAGE